MAEKINAGDRRRKLRALYRRDGSLCFWCSVELDFRAVFDSNWKGHPELGWRPTLDHFVPRSKGGSDKIKNLVLACDWCNQKRGNKTPNQFRQWLRRNMVPLDKRRKRRL